MAFRDDGGGVVGTAEEKAEHARPEFKAGEAPVDVGAREPPIGVA
jgi:hypothetical protein